MIVFYISAHKHIITQMDKVLSYISYIFVCFFSSDNTHFPNTFLFMEKSHYSITHTRQSRTDGKKVNLKHFFHLPSFFFAIANKHTLTHIHTLLEPLSGLSTRTCRATGHAFSLSTIPPPPPPACPVDQ